MTGSWGWQVEPSDGIWRFGSRWFRPFVAAAPWVTLLLLLVMIYLLSNTLTRAEGTLFDLSSDSLGDAEAAEMVATVLPMARETLVFFDDARYSLEDASSLAALGEHLSERAAQSERKTLLVLLDRRIASGEMMRIAARARESGVRQVLIAGENRHAEVAE